MHIRTYQTEPEKLEFVLERIIRRGESTGSWIPVERFGRVGLESNSGCLSRVRVEILDGEPSPEAA